MGEEMGKENGEDKESPKNNSNSNSNSENPKKKKAKSCKGCLYYSSSFKSNARNPLCVGITRSLPQAPHYIVGESEMEASRDGRSFADFKYACVGYSVYSNGKVSSADVKETQTELPVCVGLEDAYAKYVKDYFLGKFGVSVQTYDQQNLKNTVLNGGSSDRLWWFQVCTEVAYFQVAPANDSMRSSKIDTRYHLDLCKNVFGEGIYPDVDGTNLYYGGTKIAGSKIVFTNGSQDPWRHASKQTSSPDMPSYLITCHNCGHGTDLRGCPQSPLSPEGDAKNCSSPDAVHKVRQQLIENIDLWLSQCQEATDA